ncbi:class I SAM-dependent methyltransferase [Coralliovum pocilloporae]|uniref:class I SAM-dependent methyltransferase n=1 Tax=Coralliovum pocilloporae TaxID=3066369 RepID=UPI003306E060
MTTQQDENRFESRFIREQDPKSDHFLFDLPPDWWSRPHEYHWAFQFAEAGQTVLDAACGLEHPLKFKLHDQGCNTHACDYDPRLQDQDLIAGYLEKLGGKPVSRHYFSEIAFQNCVIEQTPYADNQFDRVFCISTLEHVKDAFKRRPVLWPFRPLLKPFFRYNVENGLKEFARITKPGGLVVLTMDVPRVNVNYLDLIMKNSGLEFAGPVNRQLPADAIRSPDGKLTCFRCVLVKK